MDFETVAAGTNHTSSSHDLHKVWGWCDMFYLLVMVSGKSVSRFTMVCFIDKGYSGDAKKDRWIQSNATNNGYG